VFVGYLQILTLGVTSGLNRELPYLLGKGNQELGMERLKTAGFFTTTLSLVLMAVILLAAVILFILNVFDLNQVLMMTLAFSTGALSIQTNFLGATFRSDQAFNRLSIIQLYNSLLYFILIPLVYFFELWGYIAYQIALALFLYIGYHLFRPYKVKYNFSRFQFVKLVKVGFPMYFWGYLAATSRSIPRLVLVVFGTPLLVGLFAPAAAINAAMLNLPNYTNRYLFPQMSFKFGKNNDGEEIYRYVFKAASYLFVIMISGGVVISTLIPYTFPVLFPKYTDGILVAQIVIFSGVFYSVNSLFHNALNSVKSFKPFKYIIILRVLYIIIFTFIAFIIVNDLLLSVTIGAVLAEIFNTMSYIYFLRKLKLVSSDNN
jgi:O-antigen/teichoic acid export membrane protein